MLTPSQSIEPSEEECAVLKIPPTVRLPHPIPYQGSKRRLAPLIAEHIPAGVRTFYEPFAGSAAMTVYAAFHNAAERFVIGDSLGPLVEVLKLIVEEPTEAAGHYRAIWEQQLPDHVEHFNRIRERFNRAGDPVDLLYLICRCVKNSVRFGTSGSFTQSADKRRLGMHPDKMKSEIQGVSAILSGKTEFRVGDWMDTTADAGDQDFVYLDPPYLGTSTGTDRRYFQQLARSSLIGGLRRLRSRNIAFALSYDGMTGNRSYGPPLPRSLELTQLLIRTGRSTQSTLLGRTEQTTESLYLSMPITAPWPLSNSGYGRVKGK